MPEIKHVFSQGKMNKDLDERLVPNGQYTDASNIEVSTSEGSAIGAVQTILGNSAIPVANSKTISTSGVCVGSIADEKNDSAYWLIASSNDYNNGAPASTLTYRDIIYKTKYDSVANTHTTTPVFVDFWLEKQALPSGWSNLVSFSGVSKPMRSTTNLAVGMYVRFIEQNISEWRQITAIDGSTITWNATYTFATDNCPIWLEFTWQKPEHWGAVAFGSNQYKNRVLRFDKNKLITGINIIDDMLFWTDNNTEPKKINIKRSIAGTDSTKPFVNTKIIVEEREISLDNDVFVKEEDVTIIKKSPQTAPFLELNTGIRSGLIQTTSNVNFTSLNISDTVDIVTELDPITNLAANYRSNDILVFNTGDGDHVRARIKSVNEANVSIKIISIGANTPAGNSLFNVRLDENAQNLYEEVFVRFATRWKYIDGEYSALSPFSTVAFVPANFGYNTIKSFNVGMVNQLKELIIKDFIPNNIPSEVIQVDILYKESDSPIIYSIENISNKDISINGGINSWNYDNLSLTSTGRYAITSEKINSIIPSNQILRPWDAVPRKALSQSVVGNRLVYGNYLQNYNLENHAGDIVKPKINSFIGYREGVHPNLLTNPLAIPGGNHTADIPGWVIEPSWGVVDFGSGPNLHGGIKEADSNSGVTRFAKIHQNITIEDDTRYIVSFKVSNWSQGSITLVLIGANKFIRTKKLNGNGVYNLSLLVDEDNTTSTFGTQFLFANGKTFVIQSDDATGWIGKLSNFKLTKKLSTINNRSIKSQRSYQVGVVYADEFGRQTPVLTDEHASLKVPKSESKNINAIKVQLENSIPDFAYSFKFFVKETSSPYYNLAVDRIYKAIDGNAWLSFPSSERNKIDEESYLILKKQLNGGSVEDEEATYKVLSIKNEAPEYVRLTRKVLGTGDGISTSSGNLNGLFTNTDYRPVDDQSVLAIEKDIWINNENGAALDGLKDLLIRFADGGTNQSQYYTVDAVSLISDNGNDLYQIHLNSKISDIDAGWIMNGNTSVFLDNITFEVVTQEPVDRPEFDAKFFVKVELDPSLSKFVLAQALISQASNAIVARSDAFYVSDDVATDIGVGTATRYQKDSTSQVTFEVGGGAYNNDPTITHSADDKIVLGIDVGGDGIPDGATIASITDSTHFELSVSTTGGNKTGETLSFTPHNDDVRLYIPAGETDILTGTPGNVPEVTENQGGKHYDDSGDSGYSLGRGVVKVDTDSNSNIFVMSDYAEKKWNRILKFKKYNSFTYGDNNGRNNFFIDRVRYIGVQPLTNDDPKEGIYQVPGYWHHNIGGDGFGAHKNSTTAGRCGRGIFKATGLEKDQKNNDDNFFETDKYYMELSFSKIFAESELKDIKPGKVDDPKSYKDAWSVGRSNNTRHDNESLFVNKIRVGSKFRFSGDNSETTYVIKKLRQERRYNHTPFPGGEDDHIIAVLAGGSNLPSGIIRRIVRTSNVTLLTDDSNIKYSVKDTGGKLETPFTGDQKSNHQGLDGALTIEKEKRRFGLATNRRLTFTMEIESDISSEIIAGPGFGDGEGTNYQPINTSTSVNTNLMGEDSFQFIEFVEPSLDLEKQLTTSSPAIFETKPKTTEGLEVYYEASNFINIGDHSSIHELPWFNVYSFQNGVESNRIKDDFNQVFVDKNAIVSTTLQGEYKEDQRKYGLIYSGLYNTTTSINELNQFIAAEKITKEINPEYGSIQKTYARNSDLVALCEDKVLRILSKKDAVFNADGNTNLTATSNVLGQTIPFAGDYGISKNPESFAVESYRIYFTDKQRGAVLRLSMDGLTPISSYGMKDYFKDNLKPTTSIVGSYDASKDEYNVTLKGSANTTISYSEDVKGWSSFKSFIPEQALSVANNYYSFASQSGNAKVWWHHKNNTTGNFYGTQYFSNITMLLNDSPSLIKTFKTLSYEGTQAKVEANTDAAEGEYYNLTAIAGWNAESITTDKQTGSVNEFIEKEGKWFNFIKGDTTTLSNLDTGEFTVQGLGVITSHETN